MINLAIQILWLVIGIVCLAAIVWLVLYGINTFIYRLPARVEQGIWFIVLCLVLIAILTLLAGGSIGPLRPFRITGLSLLLPAISAHAFHHRT